MPSSASARLDRPSSSAPDHARRGPPAGSSNGCAAARGPSPGRPAPGRRGPASGRSGCPLRAGRPTPGRDVRTGASDENRLARPPRPRVQRTDHGVHVGSGEHAEAGDHGVDAASTDDDVERSVDQRGVAHDGGGHVDRVRRRPVRGNDRVQHGGRRRRERGELETVCRDGVGGQDARSHRRSSRPRRVDPAGRRGCSKASPRSSSSSTSSARAMWSWRSTASITLSSVASAAVCDAAARWPAADRPALSSATGLPRPARRQRPSRSSRRST